MSSCGVHPRRRPSPPRATRLWRALTTTALAAVLASTMSAVPAQADEPVEVAAVVQDADGRVEVVRRKAANPRDGRRLAATWRGERGVLAAGVRAPLEALETSLDPMLDQQWGLARLQAHVVWQRQPGARPVVAVVDTGVDKAHPDLAGVVLPGVDLIASGDGGVDPHGHGTHVAGVASAVAGNGHGGAGLGQGVDVLPVRVLDASASGWDDVVAEGVLWAGQHGADVINLSLGSDARSPVLDAAIAHVLEQGSVVVAAAGNGGPYGAVFYPAATPGVLAVGATRPDDALASFSSTGPHLALVAPGVEILSTAPGGGYATRSGTSMAAPFVSAAAALLRSDAPDLDPAAVVHRLRATALDLGEPGDDAEYGSGLLDVVAARTDCAQQPDADADGVDDVCDAVDDMRADHPVSSYARSVVLAGISSGCSRRGLLLDFCPERLLTRAEAAVWLLRGTGVRAADLPPYDQQLADVPQTHPLATWMAELVRTGISAGCGRDDAARTLFCPSQAVTRQELAVLLLRAAGVASSSLAPYDGRYADVPTSHPYASWIGELGARGITSGCVSSSDGAAAFCPAAPVSRGQAAVLFARTFTLG